MYRVRRRFFPRKEAECPLYVVEQATIVRKRNGKRKLKWVRPALNLDKDAWNRLLLRGLCQMVGKKLKK
jgi:hypothetical protein